MKWFLQLTLPAYVPCHWPGEVLPELLTAQRFPGQEARHPCIRCRWVWAAARRRQRICCHPSSRLGSRWRKRSRELSSNMFKLSSSFKIQVFRYSCSYAFNIFQHSLGFEKRWRHWWCLWQHFWVVQHGATTDPTASIIWWWYIVPLFGWSEHNTILSYLVYSDCHSAIPRFQPISASQNKVHIPIFELLIVQVFVAIPE